MQGLKATLITIVCLSVALFAISILLPRPPILTPLTPPILQLERLQERARVENQKAIEVIRRVGTSAHQKDHARHLSIINTQQEARRRNGK
jgi:hypothetical protein